MLQEREGIREKTESIFGFELRIKIAPLNSGAIFCVQFTAPLTCAERTPFLRGAHRRRTPTKRGEPDDIERPGLATSRGTAVTISQALGHYCFYQQLQTVGPTTRLPANASQSGKRMHPPTTLPRRKCTLPNQLNSIYRTLTILITTVNPSYPVVDFSACELPIQVVECTRCGWGRKHPTDH